MTSDPTARKAINNVITREALINCDFSGNVLDEVDQAQVYIRDAIIVLAKEIWYCIDSLTNRDLSRFPVCGESVEAGCRFPSKSL